MISETDRLRRVERIFVRSGVIWQLGTQGYWLLFFVRLVVDLDLDPLQLVLLGTAKEITVLASEIPTGVVADLYSRKWSVVMAFLISGTSVILAGVLDSFLLLLISSALWGFGLTFRSGAETAWLTDELGSAEAAEPIVIRRARIELIAVVLGAAAAAGLAMAFSLSSALIVLGSGLVLQGASLAVSMPETGFRRVRERRARQLRQLLTEGATAVRRVSALRILFAATVMAGFGSEAVDRLYVRRLDDLSVVGWTGREVVVVGAILVAQSIGAAILLRIFGRRLQGTALVPALALLLAGTAVGVIILAQVNVLYLAALGLIIQGTMRSISKPVVVVWTNAYAANNTRATVHSFIGQAHSLGEITGGIVLGLVAALTNLSTALTGSAILYSLAAATAWQARRSRQSGPELPAPGPV
ncbi:MAG: hypothetical protein JJE47_08585 [Acidimicrobiia bacterium]|nr:hypothetical protein [Acidimicrobiia bacterium]